MLPNRTSGKTRIEATTSGFQKFGDVSVSLNVTIPKGGGWADMAVGPSHVTHLVEPDYEAQQTDDERDKAHRGQPHERALYDTYVLHLLAPAATHRASARHGPFDQVRQSVVAGVFMEQIATLGAEQPVDPFSAAFALNARVDSGAMRAVELQLTRFRVQRAISD